MKNTIAITCMLAMTSVVFAQTDEQKAQQQEAMEAVKKMMQDGNMAAFGMGASTTVDKVFIFHHSVDMQVNVMNSKEQMDHKMDYTMYLSKDADHFGMTSNTEFGNMTVVYELAENRVLMMSENGPMGKMGMMHTVPETKEEADNEQLNLKKTGKTKMLLGRKCEEWAGTDDGHEYSMWMAIDAPFSFAKAYQEMARAQNKGKAGNNYPDGMLLEMTSTDTSTGTSTHLVATAINENISKKISTKGWEFMQVGL